VTGTGGEAGEAIEAVESRERSLRGWGGLATIFYAIHAGQHILHGRPEDLLWACHLGALVVGLGLIVGRARIVAVGFLWLCLGNVFWLLDLAGGGELIPTSLLTHVGGLAIGLLGVVRLGIPRGSAWHAIVAFILLQQICRWTTPAAVNINLAHSVWIGWEETFPSYWSYQAALLGIGLMSFALIEAGWRRARRLR
jgi:hypothetical protein